MTWVNRVVRKLFLQFEARPQSRPRRSRQRREPPRGVFIPFQQERQTQTIPPKATFTHKSLGIGKYPILLSHAVHTFRGINQGLRAGYKEYAMKTTHALLSGVHCYQKNHNCNIRRRYNRARFKGRATMLLLKAWPHWGGRCISCIRIFIREHHEHPVFP